MVDPWDLAFNGYIVLTLVIIISKTDEIFYRIKYLQNNGGGLVEYNMVYIYYITFCRITLKI